MRLAVVVLLVVGCWTAPTPTRSVVPRDCPMQRVETRTGDDCVSEQKCENIPNQVEAERCTEIPREVCSNSGCEVKYETKCETAYETVYEESCGLVHECPVCPELRDSYNPTPEDSYSPFTPDYSYGPAKSVSRDCPMLRVETITGDDCVFEQVCESIRDEYGPPPPVEDAYGAPAAPPISYEEPDSCYEVPICPVCPELRDAYTGPYDPPSHGHYNPPSVGHYDPPSVGHYDPPSVGQYDPPSVGPYDPPSVGHYDPPSVGHFAPPSVGHYDPPSVGHYDPPSVGPYDPPSVGHYDPPSFDSYAPQDDSKSPLSKILTGLRNIFG